MANIRMTRAQFFKIARELLDEMESDHEEYTGIGVDEEMRWIGWVNELTALYDNTRGDGTSCPLS